MALVDPRSCDRGNRDNADQPGVIEQLITSSIWLSGTLKDLCLLGSDSLLQHQPWKLSLQLGHDFIDMARSPRV